MAPSIISSWAPYSLKRSILRWPAGNALMVSAGPLATHWVSSMDSTPWSWTARSPIWLAISMTRVGASSRKTPTVTVSWGRRFTMSATADGAIWRGEGAKTNPTADAPIPTASRASASVVIPQIFTNTSPTLLADPSKDAIDRC